VILKGNHIHLEGRRYLNTLSATEVLEESRPTELHSQQPEVVSSGVFQRRIEALQDEVRGLQERLQQSEASVVQAAQTARDEGFQAGEIEGSQKQRLELKESFELIDRMEREFRRTAAVYHENSDKALLKMARWMAEKILTHEIPLEGIDGLLLRIRAMMEHWVGETVYRFHLNPTERKQLLESSRAVEIETFCEGRIEWIKSPEIPPGGCRLDLTQGMLEGTPSEMLEHIEQSLIGALKTRRSTEEEA
jgi:flagellar assembly protein FliH